MNDAGDILHPTVHWSDLRSTPQAERLETDCGDAILATTLCQVNPAWTLPQLLWLRENKPAVLPAFRPHPGGQRLCALSTHRAVIRRILYDAIGTQLYDVQAGAWSPALLDIVGFGRGSAAGSATGGRYQRRD